jgi:RNA polymerase sigma-70 factor (ECF subfamily)
MTSSNQQIGAFHDSRVLAKQGFDLNQFLDGLYGYAMVLSRNRAEAEDLVQETCLRALRGMSHLRAEASAKSWLFAILRNIWLNQLRQRRTAPEIVELDSDTNSATEPPDAAQNPHADYVTKIERERVRIAIRELPVESREIIILREYEALSYHEIAAVLGCPAGTVMSRLARARSKLREVLTTGLISFPKATREADETSRAAVCKTV